MGYGAWEGEGDGAVGAREHRAAPVGSLAAARVGSLRGSSAAAPLPLLSVVLLRGLLDSFSHPFPSSFPACSQLSVSLLSFCPLFLPHPSSALPSRSPGASSPSCGSLQPDSPPSSWLLLSPLPSWLPPANSVASRSRKLKGQVGK